MIPCTLIFTENNIVLVSLTGKVDTISSDHENFKKIELLLDLIYQTESSASFKKGDRIKCIDDLGLGQTDIHKNGIYTVDKIENNKEQRIWIGVAQGIGRYYVQDRFVIYKDENIEYDRGYDYGYHKGISEGNSALVKPEYSNDDWGNGLVDGWNASMKENPTAPQTINPVFEDDPLAAADYGSPDLVEAPTAALPSQGRYNPPVRLTALLDQI